MQWEDVLREVRDAVGRSSQAAVAKDIGVGESAVSRWLSGTREATGASRSKAFQWAERRRRPVPLDIPPILQGRSVEIEALLEYALERQRRLTSAIAAVAMPPSGARRGG